MKMKTMGGCLLGALLLTAAQANAVLSWSVPLGLNDPNVVGIKNGITGDVSPDEMLAFAQKLVDMDASDTAAGPPTGPRGDYTTSNTEYGTGGLGSATLAIADKQEGGRTHVGPGFEYVIAKYDGQNGGFVLFYLGGEEADLPTTSYSIWGDNAGQYEISQFVAFNVVPEPSTYVAGALLLLPVLAQIRRWKRSVA